MHQSDQELQKTIVEELRFDPSVESALVTVAVTDGTARLSGEVASLAEKLAACRSVMRISGVKAMADEMTVKNSGTSDSEISGAAREAIKWAATVPKDSVKADVRDHVITLSGTVTWHYQSEAAMRAVTNLRGVTAISNHIALSQPDSAEHAEQAVGYALRRNALLSPQAIAATVDGHELILRGSVPTFAAYRQAEQTAWAAPGITSVRNDLTIVS